MIDYLPRSIITETGGYIGHFVYCVIAIQQHGIFVHHHTYHVGLSAIAQSACRDIQLHIVFAGDITIIVMLPAEIETGNQVGDVFIIVIFLPLILQLQRFSFCFFFNDSNRIITAVRSKVLPVRSDIALDFGSSLHIDIFHQGIFADIDGILPALQGTGQVIAIHHGSLQFICRGIVLKFIHLRERQIFCTGNLTCSWVYLTLIADIGAAILVPGTIGAGAEVKADARAPLPLGCNRAALLHLLPPAIGNEHPVAPQTVGMNLGARGNAQGIFNAIHTDACGSGTLSQNIGTLRDGILRAIDMQTNTQRHIAVGTRIGCSRCIARRIAMGVVDNTTIAINGIAEISLAVQIITQILHNRQLSFHKRSVVAIGAMAHHARGLQVGALEAIEQKRFPGIHRQARHTIEGCTIQHFRDMVAHKISITFFAAEISIFGTIVNEK